MVPRMVYRASLPDDRVTLFARSVTELETTQLFEGVVNDRPAFPFISSDGESVGFIASESQTLKKVSILGGPVATMCDCGVDTGGASWAARST